MSASSPLDLDRLPWEWSVVCWVRIGVAVVLVVAVAAVVIYRIYWRGFDRARDIIIGMLRDAKCDGEVAELVDGLIDRHDYGDPNEDEKWLRKRGYKPRPRSPD